MRNGTSNRKKLNARNIRYRKKNTENHQSSQIIGKNQAQGSHKNRACRTNMVTKNIHRNSRLYEGQRITQLLFKRNKVYETIVL